MESSEVQTKLHEAKELGKDRKFSQSVDMIVNLKGLDLKKNDNQLDFYINLKNSIGKKLKICALVGPELKDEAEAVCDRTIPNTEFKSFKPQEIKKLASEYDYFIAQANVMPQVAQAFGRILGPRGKMPNPKAGCVVPPKANLQPLYDRLQKTVRITAKKDPVIHVKVGNEKQDEAEVIENITMVYNQIKNHLPQERDNIKQVLLKLTMGGTVAL